MDKILMLRTEGHMGARRIYIGMRRQAPELGPMSYAYAGPARDTYGRYSFYSSRRCLYYSGVSVVGRRRGFGGSTGLTIGGLCLSL